MYAYIRMIELSYSWQVERWILKRSKKISKNAICHFLLLFVDVNSGIPQKGHLQPKEMNIYQTILFSVKTISFEKANCVDIVTHMYGHCYIHMTILVKSQKQINKSCVIYLCYYHYSIIYELGVYFVSFKYKKMVRNDKTMFVKLSYNINVGTCAIYPLYNSIDKYEKTFFSHSLIVLFIYFWNAICLFCK
jgi:hypothetical protein